MIADKEFRLALKFVLTATAVAILLLVLYKLAPIITIFVIALFIVYCITPLVNFLVSKKVKPLLAALVATLSLLLATLLFFYLLMPGLIGELRQLGIFLATDVADDITAIITWLEELDRSMNLQLSQSFIEYFAGFVNQIPSHVEQLLKSLTALSMQLLSRAWIVLTLAFLVFYLVQDLEKAKENLTLLFPRIYRADIARILGIVDQKVGAYIRGTLLKSALVGLLTGLGLSLMGMPFGLMLGILAGGLNIILYLGPVLAAVPALLLSIPPVTPHILLVLALYIVVQILDAFVFTPVLLGKAVDLSPLTVVVVVLIGGQLLGVAGIILAIPITAILKVLLFHYYQEKRRAAD